MRQLSSQENSCPNEQLATASLARLWASAGVKFCPECQTLKSSDNFGRDRSAPDGLQRRCWGCYRTWYRDSREQVLARAAARRLVARAEAQRRLEAWFLEHPCVDCGESDIRVLELDHREGEPKRSNISRMLSDALNWATIEREIASCDARCVNCHRRRTMERAASWRQAVYLEQLAAADKAESVSPNPMQKLS